MGPPRIFQGNIDFGYVLVGAHHCMRLVWNRLPARQQDGKVGQFRVIQHGRGIDSIIDDQTCGLCTSIGPQ